MPNPPRLRSALWLPLFDELSDPVVVMRIAAEAEEAGWHGLFVWDHLCWRAPVRAVADPWITLAAAATVTERLQIGPMVTPLPRRRPTKVARETATLDRLSNGPVNLERPDQLAAAVATISELRTDPSTPFDVAVARPAGTDIAAFADAGATWWLTDFEPESVTVDEVRGVLRDGPA